MEFVSSVSCTDLKTRNLSFKSWLDSSYDLPLCFEKPGEDMDVRDSPPLGVQKLIDTSSMRESASLRGYINSLLQLSLSYYNNLHFFYFPKSDRSTNYGVRCLYLVHHPQDSKPLF
jgi:hypothetical protein